MKSVKRSSFYIVLSALFVSLFLFLPAVTFAHCDGLDGPVVVAAKKALESGNVKPVLIWVQKKDEQTVQDAFEKTLAVRKLDPKAKAWVGEKGYDPVFGARPLKRFLQRNIETSLARALISGEVAEGSAVTYKVKGDALVMG